MFVPPGISLNVILSIFPLCHPERSEGSFSHRIRRSAKEDPSSASPPQDDRVRELRFSGGQDGKTALLRETGRESSAAQKGRNVCLFGMTKWNDTLLRMTK